MSSTIEWKPFNTQLTNEQIREIAMRKTEEVNRMLAEQGKKMSAEEKRSFLSKLENNY